MVLFSCLQSSYFGITLFMLRCNIMCFDLHELGHILGDLRLLESSANNYEVRADLLYNLTWCRPSIRESGFAKNLAIPRYDLAIYVTLTGTGVGMHYFYHSLVVDVHK